MFNRLKKAFSSAIQAPAPDKDDEPGNKRAEQTVPATGGNDDRQPEDDVSTDCIIDYFSRVLRRGDLGAVTYSGSDYITVSPECLAAAQIPQDKADKLFAAHAAANHKPKFTPPETLSVAISPVTAVSGKKKTGILTLAAELWRDGTIEAAWVFGSNPWIPAANLLSPGITPENITVGTMDSFFRAFDPTDTPARAVTNHLELCHDFFERVAGKSVGEFAAEHTGTTGMRIVADKCYVRVYDRIRAVDELLQTYEFLAQQDKKPPLFETMAVGFTGKRTHTDALGTSLHQLAAESCGSMSRNYCLTDSQRTAVHGFLASGSGEVTAVTGPPGTGKTTMLQSVVANLLTRHALTGKRPPVIVGTSTNNQAVTNIISSFSSVAADNPGPWETRWLPAKPAPDSPGPLQPLKSLAVYCPSKAKLDRAEKQYLVETPGRQKTYADYTAPDYLEKAEDYFVSRFTEATGTHRPQLSIREVKNIIHGHLVEIDRVRCTLIDTMAESGPGPKFSLACAGLDRLPMVGDCTDLTQIADCTSLTELDRVLDTTLRYAEFWLAAHYWEATWLEEKDRFFDKNERFKTTGPFNDTYWSQAPCLTPCFVMTVYQLPKYFHVYTDTHHPRSFDLNRIDLLIVDEAGQVGAPLGLPAFALADRALVVGDEKQLSPIWTLTETTDCEIARKSGISDSAWQNNLKKRGLTASNPSNLMRVASHAGRWCHGTAQATTQPGLLLLEHFRCHPDIIGFSNKLLYDGLLKPSRPKESFRLTDQGLEKHIQFITLPASKDTRLGNSRYNTAEARAVADWIVDNYAHLHAMYHPGEPVAADELIAVVTPFKPQVDKIRKAISKAVDDAPDEKNLPADLATAITVGTAHALQGAERPVVVFSPVYGENSAQSGFIDDHPQLMNVAVSRARDLFVVIGAPVRWNRGPVFSVLARHAEKTRDVFPHCTPAPGVSTQPETSSPGAPEPPISATGLLRRWQAMNILHDNDTLSTAAELNQRLSAAGVLQGGAGHWSPTPLAEYLGAELQPLKRPGQQPVNYVLYNEQLQEILTGMYLDGKLADTTNP